ncbi:hypothetical protein BH24ACT18_BH24ACT18_04150 [soil metagenome]
MSSRGLPALRMGSYLAFEELGEASLVPVRVERLVPVVALSYEPIPCGLLMPEGWHYGEWPHLSVSYREMLDRLGVERVAAELNAISERHGGRGLVLLDHDSPVRVAQAGDHGQGHGDTTARVVFAHWWEREAGEPVLEVLPDGTTVHPSDFPKRVRPVQPKDWKADRRWRDAPDVPWPPTEEDVLRWIEAVHWQTARSKGNPHQYNVRHWGPPVPFWRVVMWIRETGRTEVWGGETFRYRRIGGHKYWSMGATLPSTIILNRKEWGQDPCDRDEAAEEAGERQGGEPAESAGVAPPLFDRDGRPLSLAQRINAEHHACALAAGAALRHAVRCGALLREAKAEASHGAWLPWLRENFEGAPRTAQLYMKLHRERSGAETTLRTANTQAVAHSRVATAATRRESA